MKNFEATVKLEALFKDLSALRNTQDYIIEQTEDPYIILTAYEIRNELDSHLLEIKKIKTLIFLEQ